MKKRLLAMLLSTVMIVSLLPTAALAADGQMQAAQDLSANAVTAVAAKTAEAEAFEKEMEAFRSGMEKALKDPGAKKLTELAANIGLVTDKWKDVTATEGTDYNYDVVSNTLSVSTAAGLAWMAKQVNADSLVGTAVTLADDIDLSGKLWTPAQNFTGTFDGQGHTISGLTINNEVIGSKLEYLGLFRNIAGTADKHSFVKNVTFENVTVYAPSFLTAGSDKIWPYFGTVAGYSDYTDYENITVTGTVTLYADYAAAGIVMAKEDDSTGNSFRSCTVNAAVYSEEDFYGVVGYVDAGTLIENCSVSGSFYTNSEFAGIAYEAKGGVTIRGCSVSGDLYAHSTAYGICYELGEYDEEDEQNVMADCSVALSAWVDSSFFGLTGSTNGDSTTTDCHVSGTFYIDSEFCGLMEYLYGGGTVQDCSVSGKVYAGYMMEGGMDELYGAENTERAAKVTRVQVDLTAYAEDGGICLLTDETDENVIVSDCTFAGTCYSLKDYFAGIVGDAGIGSSLTLKNCTVTATAWLGKEAGTTYMAISNGGLVGNVSGRNLTIMGCSFTGGFYMATTRAFYLGGLVGDAGACEEMVEITDSNVTGDMLCVAESIGDIHVGGLIGGDPGWSADKLNIENCHFKGNLIAKATGDGEETKINRIGALAACIDANDLTVKNCTAESRIVLDGRCGGGATNHAGAMFGGLKYPDEATVSDCSFTGDVTVLGKEDALFNNDHFGMIVGEDCASKLNLSNITVNGDYYAEYAKSSYFGGGIGHRCCDEDLTANKVTINTDITMEHSGSVDDIGGFVGKNATHKMAATDCAYNGNITIEMLPSSTTTYAIGQLGGFLAGELGETVLSHCAHSGNISVRNAKLENVGGFISYVDTSGSDAVNITNSYTFGDIALTNCTLDSSRGVGQWIGEYGGTGLTVKNCYSVGDLTIDASDLDGYIGNVIGLADGEAVFDNYYHAGKLTVTGTGTPNVGYLTGDADESCVLTNAYYDKENFAASTLNGTTIELALGAKKDAFEGAFVPLSTQQMQANRYATAISFKKLDGTPAVADPHWDYLNGEIYANEIDKKAALVDALNAGKDGYLNWRVDGTSFRGYPFFGQSWSILYYADHGSGNELLHIEQFDKTGTKAKEIPTPDPAKYPGMVYAWKDQDGKVFNANTSLDGDKMVYATLVRASSGSGGHSSPSSTGTLNIIKTDATDKNTYLPGAKFEIYDSNGKLVGTYMTDEKGQIKVPGLANGKYYAVETIPPKGYLQDGTKHEFTISNGKVTTLVLTGTRTGVPDMLNGDDHFAYIIGRSDGLVHPDAPITRAEVTTIFFRLLAPTVRDANLSYTNTFSDVNADLWCNTAISTMTKLGIVHGRTASTFDPNAFITRAEFAAIAARFDKSSVSQLANFSDISGHWAALEISKAAANGWVNGYSDGTFKPDRNITRAEAMALINRVLNRVPETVNDLLPDMVTWPDNMNTSTWCYLDVQEATNSHDYERKSNGCETWTKLTKVPDWKIYEN